MEHVDLVDTIVAISTPRGESGIGIVRLSGPEAVSIGRQVFHCSPPLGTRIRYVEYGHVRVDGRAIDVGLAWVLKGPHSYTGEDMVEISCHGSTLILEALVQAALSRGAVLAAPGEFTRRAFLRGRIDLLQAEAVIDLIQAGSRSSLDNAYKLISGHLSRLIQELRSRIVQILSFLEVGLDFAEEESEIEPGRILCEIQEVIDRAVQLVDTFEGSRQRQRGFAVAIVGRPNVGKSTLLNTLLGEERAIVTPVPGTTRDLVEGLTSCGGELVRLIDTAGLCTARDPVEREGVARAMRAVESADLVLAVLDASRKWEEEDGEVLELLRERKGIVVLNKVDLPRGLEISPLFDDMVFVEISALTGEGIVELRRRILEQMPHPRTVDGVGITRQRHRDCLLRVVDRMRTAKEMVVSLHPDECIVAEVREALEALGEILGEDVGGDVLDRIFSDFCIGK